MKARIKNTGEIIEVERLTNTAYARLDVAQIYRKDMLDFDISEPKEEVTIEGWVAIDEAYDVCFLHTSKTHQESQGIADTGDYNTVWESDEKTYLLDRGFFPGMDSDSEPMEVEITIKPKKKSI